MKRFLELRLDADAHAVAVAAVELARGVEYS
jgi:hypothetical protein